MAESHRIGATGVMEDQPPAPNRIAAFRAEKGWSRPRLAERMKTSTQQVERLEKGQRKLTQEWMQRAGAALEIDPAALLPESTGRIAESRTAYRAQPLRPDLRLSDQPPIVSASRDDGAIALRVLDLDLSMGDGSNIDDYVEETMLDFDAALLRSITRTPAEHLFLARGSGDSMFPTLVNGDMVMIDTLQRRLNLQDRLWAIALFGAGGIKRLQPVGESRVEVISDNPARENREVDAQDLRILGRVIWLGREV